MLQLTQETITHNHTQTHTHMHLHCLPWCLTWATCCDQTAIKRWSCLLCVVLFGSPFISDPPSISQRFSQPESFIVPSPLTISSYSCYFPHALDRSLTAAASSVTFIFYFFLVVSSVCPQLLPQTTENIHDCELWAKFNIPSQPQINPFISTCRSSQVTGPCLALKNWAVSPGSEWKNGYQANSYHFRWRETMTVIEIT